MEVQLTRRQERCLIDLQARHGRKKSDYCLCEGVRCCGEVLHSPMLSNVELAIVTPETRNCLAFPETLPLATVSADELQKLSGTVTSQGVLLLMHRPEAVPGDEPNDDPFVFAVDQLGDPGNFGTILRTARATGLHELWYTAGSVDPYSSKVIRSALGAQFSMRLRGFATLERLFQQAAQLGFLRSYLTDPHQGESCFTAKELFQKSVIVIGSEAHGIAESMPGRRIMIPMPGNFESLNAAQAATIVLFEYVRRLTSTQA